MGLGGESGSEPEAGEPLLYHARIEFVKINFIKRWEFFIPTLYTLHKFHKPTVKADKREQENLIY